MNGELTLLSNGYISQTFQSHVARQYFLNLLKSTSVPLHLTLSYLGWEGYPFFVLSVPPHIPPPLSSQPGPWILDRGTVNRGTVIPQMMWSPDRDFDKRQLIIKAQLQMPVFFEKEDQTLGISLAASTDSLRDANLPTLLGQKLSTYIRIAWPGYKEIKRQVPIREPTGERNPISVAMFALHIVKSVNYFIENRESDTGSDNDRRELWRIGPGGIQSSDIVIIGAVHVSKGSWMPIMQLNGYLFRV